jgi:competence protein ComFC
MLCENISLNLICNSCQLSFLAPNIKKRNITKEVLLYSFYDYNEISDLILTKYNLIGSRIYKILANNSFKKFASIFKYPDKVYAIAIDDKVKKGYSHTSILANSIKNKSILVLHNSLISQNNIKYANKSLEFRLKNPRNFKYTNKHNINAILIDDIVVSGSTMKEAIGTLELAKVNVLFAICLCDKSL